MTARKQKVSLRETTVGKVVKPNSLKIEKNRPESNGVRRPSVGGICRLVWDRLDRAKECPTMEQLRKLVERHGWALNTAVTQYQRWKKFHGVGPSEEEE